MRSVLADIIHKMAENNCVHAVQKMVTDLFFDREISACDLERQLSLY